MQRASISRFPFKTRLPGTSLRHVVHEAHRCLAHQILQLLPPPWQRDTAHLTSWYQTFYGKGCGPLVDYLNFHYYNCPHGPNGGNSFAPTFHLYWQLLSQLSASHGFSGMDVWCTETGYPTSIHPDYDCTVTEEMRQSHFQITLDDARTSGVISHLFFYTIDCDRAGTSVTLGYPPTRTYTPTYGLVKSYIATYPTWSMT
jgi:hypothetical protein